MQLLIIAIIVFIFIKAKQHRDYKNSTYHQTTHYPYRSVLKDLGRVGEYFTYQNLRHLEANGAKFLFNLYIPKANGETTEIDVLMICSKGIFVFESKNFSGWIFGNESQKYWYQTLPAGRYKSYNESFYNPIMQNRSHIKHLRAFLNKQVPMQSIIVFSDRCTLKEIQVHSQDVHVVKRNQLAYIVDTLCRQMGVDILYESDIADIYRKLYPHTQIDEATKLQHIANIRR